MSENEVDKKVESKAINPMEKYIEPDFIDEFAVIGDFGFRRHIGPWEVGKFGTVWLVIFPVEDLLKHFSKTDEGHAASLVDDGSLRGGGIITGVCEYPNDGETHVLVDQYLKGKPAHRLSTE